jgi:ParB-like chromosome segregation protein Spo0J
MNTFKPLIAQTKPMSHLASLTELQSNRLKDDYVEHPEDRKYQAVEKAVLEEGLLYPIKVNKKDMIIITGNQRSWFAKKHGYTHISAEFVE